MFAVAVLRRDPAMLAVVVVMMVLLWQRQQAAQHEVSEVTRTAMHSLISEQVRIDGEAEVRQLADAPRQSPVLLRPRRDR
jgi:hypothetical protein